MFMDVLRAPSLTTTYLIVDALDECVTDLPKLLEFVARQSSASCRIKWMVSSRNWPEIEGRLEQAGHKVRLSLELNAASVSTAVKTYIKQRASKLAQHNRHSEQTKRAVLKHLTLHANDTFLWVALVCQHLQATADRNVLRKLELFPPGLDALYKRMMQQIDKTDEARLCKQVLAAVALVYRPITLKELVTLVKPLESVVDSDLQEIINLCGSFLILREQTVYFVHQSAKDFLLAKAAQDVFPAGQEAAHWAFFDRSLQVMSKTLRRNMYGLKAVGTPIDDIEVPEPDPLVALRYSCVHWVDHLCDSSSPSYREDSSGPLARDSIIAFVRQKYLYWLEALSLCQAVPKGITSMTRLEAAIKDIVDTSELHQLVYDACRFIMYHKGAIESSPLQVYASALIFSPTSSLIRNLFRNEAPKDIYVQPGMTDDWSSCLQTLEGHSNWVNSVAFSPDATQLASASYDTTVKIWDASSGACLKTLKGHRGWVNSVAFSPDATQLASASDDKTIKIWDADTGECLHTLEGHTYDVTSVDYSRDSTYLASASLDGTVKIWNANDQACLHTLKGHSEHFHLAVFSHDSTRLATASHKMVIWDVSSGECLQTLEGHSGAVTSITFSYDSTQLASSAYDKTVKIWNIGHNAYLNMSDSHEGNVRFVTFSYDSSLLASASKDKTVKIWDTSSGACLQTLEGHSASVTSVAFSRGSTWLASASFDRTARLWDVSSGTCLRTFKGHGDRLHSVAFSYNSTRLASSSGNIVKIWDLDNGMCLHTLKGHKNTISSMAFSNDSTILATASADRTVRIWNADNGAYLHTLKGHSDYIRSVAFSNDSTILASASDDETVRIWDMSSNACLCIYEVNMRIQHLSFNDDNSRLHTDAGMITIGASSVVPTACPMRQTPQYSGLGLSPDTTWITRNSDKLLWLPSDYRPSSNYPSACVAVLRNMVAIGNESGRVRIFEFAPDSRAKL